MFIDRVTVLSHQLSGELVRERNCFIYDSAKRSPNEQSQCHDCEQFYKLREILSFWSQDSPIIIAGLFRVIWAFFIHSSLLPKKLVSENAFQWNHINIVNYALGPGCCSKLPSVNMKAKAKAKSWHRDGISFC